MIISLLGYMGSGKSHIARLLGKSLNCAVVDLDRQIEEREGLPVSRLFAEKGEIYFRRVERETLHHILAHSKSCVLSLGGGTPVYYNNMEYINAHSLSIYLRAAVPTLAARLLLNTEKRPLIAHISAEDLPEFIAKHLFERNAYYSQAKICIDTDQLTPREIVQECIARSFSYIQEHPAQ